jgi:PAS domain S-box-containing protein
MAATAVRLDFEVERLRSQVSTLEQLLAVHEKTALEQSRRLENIVDSISDGFFVLSREGRVTYLNHVAGALFARMGADSSDLLGRPLWAKFPSPGGGVIEQNFRRALHERTQITFEASFEAVSLHLEFHAYPWDEGLSVLFQDVSARKLNELRREQMQLELERQVQLRTADLQATLGELEAFSYSVSHDLRAPLRSLDGFSQALLEDYSDSLESDGKLYLERIRANAQKMAHLIDALLQLSRVTRAEFHPALIDLSALVRQIASDVHASDPGRNCEFSIEDGIVAEADARLIEVALQNLLNNAWKFSSQRPRTRIEFGVAPYNGVLACYIRDNGAGFDMKYREKLFIAFQRLHDVREFEGTGIGLATVNRILKRHGGRIWAEAAPGHGACFYFTLHGLSTEAAKANSV